MLTMESPPTTPPPGTFVLTNGGDGQCEYPNCHAVGVVSIAGFWLCDPHGQEYNEILKGN